MSSAECAYAAAASWRALADAAQDAQALAGGAVQALRENNSGDAVDALATRWQELADPSHGVLPQLAALCRRLAEQCEREG